MRIDDRQVPVAESRLNPSDPDAVPLEPRAPVLEASSGDFQARLDGKAVADARLRHVRPRKKRQVGARAAFGVRVEQMVGARIVLVHAPLDEMHAQNAGVEIHVLLRRSRNGGDVVQSVDAVHRAPSIAVASGFSRTAGTPSVGRSGECRIEARVFMAWWDRRL